jgi:hypothetical protein
MGALKSARFHTYQLLQMVDDGMLDKDLVIAAFCKFLSDEQVGKMMKVNEFNTLEGAYEE